MAKEYLLDTNAYFNILKYLHEAKQNDEGNEQLTVIQSGHLLISDITRVEIISVLGKYARGISGGLTKCNCIISADGMVCEHQRYVTPRKKWNSKKVGAWLKMIDETIDGTSPIICVSVEPFTNNTVNEARTIIQHALQFSFGSLDAMIAATAKQALKNQRDITVITSDRSLIACLEKCSIPYIDLFSKGEVS